MVLTLSMTARLPGWGLGSPPPTNQCPKHGFIFWGGDSLVPEYCHLRVPPLVPKIEILLYYVTLFILYYY